MAVELFSNMTSIVDFLAVPNAATGGWFWIGIIFLVFIVALISLAAFGFEVALMSASFLGLGMSVMLNAIKIQEEPLVGFHIAGIFVGIIGVTIIYMVLTTQRQSQ